MKHINSPSTSNDSPFSIPLDMCCQLFECLIGNILFSLVSIMYPSSAILNTNKVGMIPRYCEVLDQHSLRIIFDGDAFDAQRRASTSDNCVPYAERTF